MLRLFSEKEITGQIVLHQKRQPQMPSDVGKQEKTK